jgi:hypothetical protein
VPSAIFRESWFNLNISRSRHCPARFGILLLLVSANQLVALGLTEMTQRLRKNIIARQILGIAEAHGYQRKKTGETGKKKEC